MRRIITLTLIAAAALCARPASAYTITQQHVFVDGELLSASILNPNIQTIIGVINGGIEHVNIGPNGIYATDVKPTSPGQATFSSAWGWTITTTGTSQVPLIVNAPSGTTVDIADFQTNGVTKASIGNGGLGSFSAVSSSGSVSSTVTGTTVAFNAGTAGVESQNALVLGNAVAVGSTTVLGAAGAATIQNVSGDVLRLSSSNVGNLFVWNSAGNFASLGFQKATQVYATANGASVDFQAGSGGTESQQALNFSNANAVGAFTQVGAAGAATVAGVAGSTLRVASSDVGNLLVLNQAGKLGVLGGGSFGSPVQSAADGTHLGYLPPIYGISGAAQTSSGHIVADYLTAAGASTVVTLTNAAVYATHAIPIIFDATTLTLATITAQTLTSVTFTSTAGHQYFVFLTGY